MLAFTKAGTETDECHGCKSEQPTRYCAVCDIKACARGKGHEFCNECSEYGACALVQKFMYDTNWPYQQAVSRNMEAIRQDGLSKWLQVQEERWCCADCGSPHWWWDDTGPQCCHATANYKADL